jgi:Bacteriophage tail sheath protein
MPGRLYFTPRVYFEELAPRKTPEFRTGIPAFLGFRQLDPDKKVRLHVLTRWAQFDEKLGNDPGEGFLRHAVRGFFENGGEICVVVELQRDGAEPWAKAEPWVRERLLLGFKVLEELRELGKSLDELPEEEEALIKELIEDVDLICVPDLPLDESRIGLQLDVLEYCETKFNCFAILDSNRLGTLARMGDIKKILRQWRDLYTTWGALLKNGALYYPWVRVPDGPVSTGGFVPPCGHIAGVYARADARIGVHKAPANEILEGVIDLERELKDDDQSLLNEVGVNCLRAFPGRGIRVWGARTLSARPEWRYVNVRRLFTTLVRWIDRNCRDLVFESYTPALWEAIRGRLNSYCYNLFQNGALKGQTPEEAYYVKCDAETNPLEEREGGRVISEIGLAPVIPAEFIVVRITQSAATTSFTGP